MEGSSSIFLYSGCSRDAASRHFPGKAVSAGPAPLGQKILDLLFDGGCPGRDGIEKATRRDGSSSRNFQVCDGKVSSRAISSLAKSFGIRLQMFPALDKHLIDDLLLQSPRYLYHRACGSGKSSRSGWHPGSRHFLHLLLDLEYLFSPLNHLATEKCGTTP